MPGFEAHFRAEPPHTNGSEPGDQAARVLCKRFPLATESFTPVPGSNGSSLDGGTVLFVLQERAIYTVITMLGVEPFRALRSKSEPVTEILHSG